MGNRCMGNRGMGNRGMGNRGMGDRGSTCIAHSLSIHVFVSHVSSPRVMYMQSWVALCMRSCFGSQHVLIYPTDMHAMQPH